jgi:hypothetical protein
LRRSVQTSGRSTRPMSSSSKVLGKGAQACDSSGSSSVQPSCSAGHAN